jgi:hypothetical protein
MHLEYRYFVSYAHTSGFGNAECFINYRLTNIDNIRKLEHAIAKFKNLDKSMITNWRLLSIKLKIK